MLIVKLAKSTSYLLVGLAMFFIISDACGNSRDEAQLKLDQARKNLSITQAAKEQIASELENLKNSGNADPEMIQNYETYLNRVQALVIENRKAVGDMETAYSRISHSAKADNGSRSMQTTMSSVAGIPEEKELDKLIVLDRELNDSLAAFDEMLLKEMDEILAKSKDRMKDLDEAAGASAGRLKEKGLDVSSSSEDNGNDELVKASQPIDNATVDPAGQPRISDQDDDIVARQLREAAEKETDPELKKKLWKEYENYKKSGS
jgi:hypothetical protein